MRGFFERKSSILSFSFCFLVLGDELGVAKTCREGETMMSRRRRKKEKEEKRTTSVAERFWSIRSLYQSRTRISEAHNGDTGSRNTHLSPFGRIDRSTIATDKLSFLDPDLLLLLFSSRITLDSICADSDTESAVSVRGGRNEGLGLNETGCWIDHA